MTEIRTAVRGLMDELFAQQVGKNVGDSAVTLADHANKSFLDKTLDLSEFDVSSEEFPEMVSTITLEKTKKKVIKPKIKVRTKKCTS